MPLDSNTIMSWAKGTKKDAVAPDGDDAAGLGLEGDDEGGAAPENSIWAGQHPPEQPLTPEDEAELTSWLEENEPEIATAVNELAQAVEMGDPALIAQMTAGLTKATQFLTPEYPPFDPAQQKALVAALTAGETVAAAIVKARAPAPAVEEGVAPAVPGAAPKKPMPPKKPMGAKPAFGAKPAAAAPAKKPPAFGAKKPQVVGT